MDSKLRALLNEPIGEGLPINELDQLLQMIQQSFNNQIKTYDVDQYMNTNFGLKLYAILKTIYHYSAIRELNPSRYDTTKLRYLILFAQMQFKKLCLVENQLEQLYLFVASVQISLKYYRDCQRIIAGFMGVVFEQYRDQPQLLDDLLSSVLGSFNSPNEEAYLSLLFILDQLLTVFCSTKIVDEQFQGIFRHVCSLNIAFNTPECGYFMANILKNFIVKLSHKQNILLDEIIANRNYSSFVQKFILSNNETTQVILEGLQRLIERASQIYAGPFNPPTPFAELILAILPQLLELCVSIHDSDDNLKTAILQFVNQAIQYQYTYDYFMNTYKRIFLTIILPTLQFTEMHNEIFIENPSEFYELIQATINATEDTRMPQAAKLLRTITKVIDGSIKFIFEVCIELINYYLDNNVTDIPLYRSIGLQSYFEIRKDDNEAQYSTVLLAIVIISKNVVKRRDLKQQIEQFLKSSLKLMKSQVYGIGRCMGVELVKRVLPKTFKQMQQTFKKCIKFTFVLLNKLGQKRAVKIFVIEFLKHMILNEESKDRFENALVDFVNEICDQAAKSDMEVYYDFVLQVLLNCNSIVDNHLDKILLALNKRIKLGCAHIDSQTVNHGSIMYNCISVIDNVLSMEYCLKFTCYIEPQLLEISQVLLGLQRFDYLDEVLNAISKYIAHTKGMTELMHITYQSLPPLMQIPNKVTVETVFQLYFQSMVHASAVMKTQPPWIELMLEFLFKNMQDHQSSGDLIKINILLHIAYQYFDLSQVSNRIQEAAMRLLELQIRRKEIISKVYITLFMPAIINANQCQQQSAILNQLSAYMQMAFSRPLTLYNYRMLFLIFHVLITRSQFIFEDQHREKNVERLFQLFLGRFTSYLEKITFDQRIGQPNLLQKVSTKMDQFDLELTEATVDDHLMEMALYNQELKIEDLLRNDLDLIPTMDLKYEKMTQLEIVQYVKQNYPGIINNLDNQDRHILDQLNQVQIVDNDEEQKIRLMMTVSKRKAPKPKKDSYHAM